MNIRPATPQDFMAMLNCTLPCLPEFYEMKYYFYHALTWPQLSYVAEQDNGKIIGCAMAKIGEDKYAYITTLAVKHAYRRTDVAVQLALQVMQATVDCFQAEYASAYIPKSNYEARSLYMNSLKFTLFKTLPKYFSDGEDALILCRDLKEFSEVKNQDKDSDNGDSGAVIGAGALVKGKPEKNGMEKGVPKKYDMDDKADKSCRQVTDFLKVENSSKLDYLGVMKNGETGEMEEGEPNKDEIRKGRLEENKVERDEMEEYEVTGSRGMQKVERKKEEKSIRGLEEDIIERDDMQEREMVTGEPNKHDREDDLKTHLLRTVLQFLKLNKKQRAEYLRPGCHGNDDHIKGMAEQMLLQHLFSGEMGKDEPEETKTELCGAEKDELKHRLQLLVSMLQKFMKLNKKQKIEYLRKRFQRRNDSKGDLGAMKNGEPEKFEMQIDEMEEYIMRQNLHEFPQLVNKQNADDMGDLPGAMGLVAMDEYILRCDIRDFLQLHKKQNVANMGDSGAVMSTSEMEKDQMKKDEMYEYKLRKAFIEFLQLRNEKNYYNNGDLGAVKGELNENQMERNIINRAVADFERNDHDEPDPLRNGCSAFNRRLFFPYL